MNKVNTIHCIVKDCTLYTTIQEHYIGTHHYPIMFLFLKDTCSAVPYVIKNKYPYMSHVYFQVSKPCSERVCSLKLHKFDPITILILNSRRAFNIFPPHFSTNTRDYFSNLKSNFKKIQTGSIVYSVLFHQK